MSTKVITGKVRFSYANVFEPYAMEGQSAKYSVCLIIDKTDTKTITDVKSAIDEALEAGKSSKFGGKIPTVYKNPLRDGDEERPDDSAFVGKLFINANSSNKPGIVDANINVIIDRDEFYSGCFGRAGVTFYAFNTNGNKGIACGLQNVQKLSEGERLSGGSTAAEDFGSAPVGDDLM